MSMTKRYLDSLPRKQQDDILGLPPMCDCNCHYADGGGLVCSDCMGGHETAEDAWWARMLAEEGDTQC